ncbi:hypothetical protein COY28_03115 [Candidatus Woesearchaeota archaeon CG_4_10_14_0_2_um_filter_57_5]|nr:MAG: hypothetical protein COY28_03115 [Candidatus Woesearchaeota archaeon CG_4_10_14_0_2_um_filter_57_5]
MAGGYFSLILRWPRASFTGLWQVWGRSGAGLGQVFGSHLQIPCGFTADSRQVFGSHLQSPCGFPADILQIPCGFPVDSL